MEDCRDYGIGPVYYNIGNNYGLVAAPYRYNNGNIRYDTTRAFVVMNFPYLFPDGDSIIVSQAFYRSSGSNSRELFGVDTDEAKGTWIPTNAYVAKNDIIKPKEGENPERGKSEIISFIMKKPFVDEGLNNILSRFHGDVQLALTSYLMGGGIWNIRRKVMELSRLLIQSGLPDYTRRYRAGCVGLTNNIIGALMGDINRYIGDSVSWNWHPDDVGFLAEIGLPSIDLNNELLWIRAQGRYFIPGNIFNNAGSVKTFIKDTKKKERFGYDGTRTMLYGPIENIYKMKEWSEHDPRELYPIL